MDTSALTDMVWRGVYSLAPVTSFLLGLMVMESYRLIRLRSIMVGILVGGISALFAVYVNDAIMTTLRIPFEIYSPYGAPVVEELLKAGLLIYLIERGKVGFAIDATIYGFALGTGFALVENSVYLMQLQNAPLSLWIIRGFGTAIMHGGTTALFGVISKLLIDRKGSGRWPYLVGLIPAAFFHSLYNHFFFPPLINTLLTLIVLAVMLGAVFHIGEKFMRQWVSQGMDSDLDSLEEVRSGRMSQTNAGRFLLSIRNQFPPEVVFDMLALYQLQLELSVRAKAILMMRESDMPVMITGEDRDRAREWHYLQKSVGRTALLMMSPLFYGSRQDIWQLQMILKETRS
ncbi:MAG: PrsW family intramembrane metalloprotease [Candidatus Marinimicrobia bacterium]|nr:PrsW family intramembrane metalloprotease [Candidatus Neomarinimicrobiota bacterium]